ncbi:MAG: 5-(carboxyamino)imidazole ribonucleotide synthase [Tagaea sp.]|nr:5-(carboxyamino)imidazole ribonucleotide synthase [Tagaea sp.]
MSGPKALAPGATLGILGNGQLGRMIALAAARLGYRTHCYGPDSGSPASQVCGRATEGDYRDEAALSAFFAACDAVTYEFENIPVEALTRVAKRARGKLRPSAAILSICQDRIAEKTFLNSIGIATAPWRAVRSLADLDAGLAALGAPAILKTARMGYDGKGQRKIRARADIARAHAELGGAVAILEGFVAFEREISVIVARDSAGRIAAYVPVENRHKHHILDETLAPAKLAPATARGALAIARKIARELDLVGIVAVEMFVSKGGRIAVNELAPRPHNSGHWTIDACRVSQFEQTVRAVMGLPLGDPARHSDARMKNLIGRDADAWARLAADPKASLHLYGKAEARPGRKMGHVTRIFPRKGPG